MADSEAIVLGEGIFNLSSPPKPTRVIQIESTTTPQRKELVQNTSSLPALAGEVAVAQKSQVLRLEKRIEFLEKLQAEHREVLRWRAAAEKHVQTVLRKSNLLQDDIDACQRNCEGLQKDINTLVCRTEKLKGEISREESDSGKEKCNYAIYEEKMSRFKHLSELAESTEALNVNITNTMKHYEMLNIERKHLHESNDIPRFLSGETKEILMAEIFTLDESISEMKDYLKGRFQISDEKERQGKLRKDVEQLQKKNQAQLMWTRKQLQETLARNKQWNEETSQKEKEIQEIRRKIEEH